MDEEVEGTDPEKRHAFWRFVALAGLFEVAFLVVALVLFGVAYTVGFHFAVLLFAVAVALFAVRKWIGS